MAEPILQIEELTIDLPPGADRRHAVEGVSFTLARDEILCVVGESGSGKSVMARSILGLLPRSPGRRPALRPSAGRILFKGEDLLAATPARLRQIRGGGIGMIFQEPMTALNPLMTIGRQIDEVIASHRRLPRRERLQRAIAMFADVRLPHPAAIVHAYPHELSGGERQRAMIAMALVLEPDILVADEPTTALDVTTQAQILALIRELRQGRGTGIIFITHDFGVVAEIADRVAVMEKGRLVEIGLARQVLNAPRHPYTRALIDAVPGLTPPPRRGVPDQTLIELRDLDKLYRSRAGLFRKARGAVHAVKHANLVVRRGETLGLVGESGSGKSTLARCIVRLVDAEHGQILFDGTDLRALSRRAMRPHRARLQMVSKTRSHRSIRAAASETSSPPGRCSMAPRASRPMPARPSFWAWSGWTQAPRCAFRTNSPAASASASASLARWRFVQTCSLPMNRSRRSMSRSSARFSNSSSRFANA